MNKKLIKYKMNNFFSIESVNLIKLIERVKKRWWKTSSASVNNIKNIISSLKEICKTK